MLQDDETLPGLTALTESIALTLKFGTGKADSHLFLNAQSSFFLKVNASGTWRQSFLKVKLEQETTRGFFF